MGMSPVFRFHTSGARTDPCGTPERSLIFLLIVSPILILIVLFFSHDLRNRIKIPGRLSLIHL